ncbi:hypothetical protein NAEGRDRAFT_79717 [Naegleria gruberi]|uniref:RGS domain-containing protein n=1 Tax=Naegleria gruberi TaxID=5762 RepID=D2VF87_NAEGR|nr:uncharacterized protein NAEGRDRAFT_79717 [Naegleria gruberi]EFC44417.1 hypothetical protein NAEGRDRAFT_79717 [Naegleria gruberi]|eukprot:XP_002677161.1 hypothetical protein NAEGRDRAFT_79717 [Naegleria gruberi strain NEG-M]
MVWFLLCLIPCLIACIIATALDFNNYKIEDNSHESCQYEVGGFIIFVTLVVVYVAAMLIMSILTHNVRKAYKESKIEVIMLVLIIFTTLFIAICFSVRLNLLIPIRIIISYVPLFLSTTYFYAVMHRVVWYTIRSWMGCNRWRRDLSFFEDWDMRFFVDSNNTIFTNEQIRRVMNLETKALNHQQLLERDDDLANFAENPFINDSSNLNIEIGNYIPPSFNSDSLQTSSIDSTTSSQMITDKKFFGLSPTPSPTNKKQLIHSSSKRNLHRVFGSSATKSFVDGDQIVTEQDIINQTLVNNINMDLEDYSPPRYYIGRDSEKRR